MKRPRFVPLLSVTAVFLAGCSPALRRPIIGEGQAPPVSGYYIRTGNAGAGVLPKTKVECESYLADKKGPKDDLIAAVCNLNLGRGEEAERLAGGLADTCYAKVIRYDLGVDSGRTTKGDRFTALQGLLDCSVRADYVKMIEVRAKLAHYE